jgi:hypothetical protein
VRGMSEAGKEVRWINECCDGDGPRNRLLGIVGRRSIRRRQLEHGNEAISTKRGIDLCRRRGQ